MLYISQKIGCMNRIYFFFVFISLGASAQIVNIPDTNFKNAIINQGIDTNSDGEIQVSEAEVVGQLSIDAETITSAEGIQSFINLQNLYINYNNLGSLDLSSNIHLKNLFCNYCQLTSLTLNSADLNVVYANNNLLTSIDLSSCPNVGDVDFSSNQLSEINLSGCSNIANLQVSNNLLESIDVSNDIALYHLYVGNNLLTSLDVSGRQYLEILAADADIQGPLVTLNASNCTALNSISVANQSLESVNIENSPQLGQIYFPNNNLNALNLSDCPDLFVLVLSHNTFEALDITSCPSITTLKLDFNNFTTFDVSTLHLLQSFDINNNQLTTLFVKNGADESVGFYENPNLEYICIDESQKPVIDAAMAFLGNTTTVYNSFCTFSPGGTVNTVSGQAHFDADNNGCSPEDYAPQFLKLNISDGVTGSTVFLNDSSYSFFTGAGDYVITPQLENPTLFNVSPTSITANFSDTNSNVLSSQDFCITANGNHSDVAISIAPIVPARPGFAATYAVTYRNKGNQIATGDVIFQYQDSVLDFVSSTISPDDQSSGSLSWNYTNLQPLETRSFEVTFNVNSQTQTPAVAIGDILSFTLSVSPTAADEVPADNLLSYDQTVVGSYDPNDKTCVEGESASTSQIGKYLHYVINFENTGTFAAENVVVTDSIDTAKFDISSLQIMETSHPSTIRVTGNKVEFIFENIQLQPQDNGNVVFKIKTLPTLTEGTTVTNQANIYFDYNFPVETNTASTTFSLLSAHDFGNAQSISMYPNPVISTLSIAAKSVITRVEIYDAQARLISVNLPKATQSSVDVSNLRAGIYFVKVATGDATLTQKIIKN
jgi:uncharacterized repeat protein (TIGR01451 family)